MHCRNGAFYYTSACLPTPLAQGVSLFVLAEYHPRRLPLAQRAPCNLGGTAISGRSTAINHLHTHGHQGKPKIMFRASTSYCQLVDIFGALSGSTT